MSKAFELRKQAVEIPEYCSQRRKQPDRPLAYEAILAEQSWSLGARGVAHRDSWGGRLGSLLCLRSGSGHTDLVLSSLCSCLQGQEHLGRPLVGPLRCPWQPLSQPVGLLT